MDFRESAGDVVRRAGVVLGRRSRGLLEQRTWNKVVQLGLGRALWAWIDVWLPKRWERAYARQLGYGGKNPTPWFSKGTFLRAAIAGARPYVVATKGMARGAVKVPIGHPMNPISLAAFQTVPTQEARFVAVEFLRATQRVLRGGVLLSDQGATGKARMGTILAADLASEAQRYGSKSNTWDQSGRQGKAANMAANLEIDRSRSMRAGHHNRGIHLGDAAPPGSKIPAWGRHATQLAANSRYRHTARGRARRAAQAVRHRHWASPGGRAAWLASYGITLRRTAA